MTISADELEKRAEGDSLLTAIIEAIRTVHDPEIPINLFDLGLIYDLIVEPAEGAESGAKIGISMTLTTPNCPVAESMPNEVRNAVLGVDGVDEASIELVWTPQWTGERMTENAKLELEFMGISWKDPKPAQGGPAPTSLTVGRDKQRG